MNKCPNNHCGERHSYVPKGVAHYVCEWCHQAQPDPEVESLRARVAELEAERDRYRRALEPDCAAEQRDRYRIALARLVAETTLNPQQTAIIRAADLC